MARNNVVEAGQHAFGGREAGPIDLIHLEQQSLGDPGLQEEVLRLYAKMSSAYVSRIEASRSSDELIGHLHTLKSAAAGIGAWDVRDLAKHAEDQVREGQPFDQVNLGELVVAVAECHRFIAGIVGED